MAAKRKSISKKTRFEVFKRDSFKCQYCGESAPDVILEVDHIDPVSKGGADEMVNYITACRSCNAGKKDRKLSDNTTLVKQRAQLEELNERREQLEMMMSWRSGMKDIMEMQVNEAASAWSECAVGFSLNEKGLKQCEKLIKKYGLSSLLGAIDIAADAYIDIDPQSGKAIHSSVESAWKKVQGILSVKSLPQDEQDLRYIKGILRNRLAYVPYDALSFLKEAYEAGVSIDDMKTEAKRTRNWTNFQDFLHGMAG